jgi:rfaE bifunctional protein nucleotidyltransferase chain/domain
MIIKEKNLINIRTKYKNKKIGLCHGVFDIIHAGHISYINSAKKRVDVLIVSITADEYVNKGPDKPYNNQIKRIQIIDNLKNVDYTIINNNLSSEKIIELLKPNFYFKGKDYLNQDFAGNLKNEIRKLKKYNGKFIILNDPLMSSSKIYNNKIAPDSVLKKYLLDLSKNQNFNKIINNLKGISANEINIIGEPIIDVYSSSLVSGLTSKDSILSIIKKNNENIAGGVIAVAKMTSHFVKKINLYTYGQQKLIKKMIRGYKNINIINFCPYKKIQIKKRYINSYNKEKLIQVSNFRFSNFSKNEIKHIIKKIRKIKNQLIICDFGIGLFSDKVLTTINNIKIKKYINVQTNSLNYGLNYFTKYKKFNYMSLNEKEWSLGLGSGLEPVSEKVIFKRKIIKNNNSISITRGKEGSIYMAGNSNYKSPAILTNLLDTTGCGDAYFALTTLGLMSKIENKFIPFIGNLYAGMHGLEIGNKKIINSKDFYNALKSHLNF